MKKHDPAFGDLRRFVFVLLLLLALLAAGVVLNVNTGSVPIGSGQICSLLGSFTRYAFAGLFSKGSCAEELQAVINASAESQILFKIRLPRMLLSMLLGGALSVSGYLLQVFFRNPIAGPFVLGISSGAKMTVAVTLILLAPWLGGLGSGTLVLSAFGGALLITSVVLLFSRRIRQMPVLLVIGIMMGYICSAVTDLCVTFASEHDVVNLTHWSMGSFSGASWADVGTAALFALLGTAAAMLLCKPLGAYALGEAYAKSIGISLRRVRFLIILISSLLSGVVTALAGPISFVGIAVPHISRALLKSSRPELVIPTCFVCGALFCLLCDLIARTAFAPTELSIGTVTSVFGAPIVIRMMLS
ncbi:MAG: iron ABC transporter permease, partial [Firmicutes bacterium]|nr:iron ABC transporter permease [Bacillota bacterium]